MAAIPDHIIVETIRKVMTATGNTVIGGSVLTRRIDAPLEKLQAVGGDFHHLHNDYSEDFLAFSDSKY